MNKYVYVLCKFSVIADDDSDDEEDAWCLCKVYATSKKKVSVTNEVYEFRIKKILKTSNNFNNIYIVGDTAPDIFAPYVPHFKKDGNIYIAIHLNPEHSRKDEVLEFENDEDALLYAELGGNNE